MDEARTRGTSVTAWLTEDAHAQLRRLSVAYGLSVSALAAMAVLDLLAAEEARVHIMNDETLKNMPLAVKH